MYRVPFIFFLFLFFITNTGFLLAQTNAEVSVYIDDNDNLKIKPEFTDAEELVLYEDQSSSAIRGNGTPLKLSDCNATEKTFGDKGLTYRCENDIIEFWKANEKQNTLIKIWYCENEEKYFSKESDFKKCNQSDGEKGSNNQIDYKDITDIEEPKFMSSISNLEYNKHNRYLIIDANPNPNESKIISLKKYHKITEDSKEEWQFREAKGVDSRGNLAVFLENYNITNLENLSVKINSLDFEYNADVGKLLEIGKKEETEQEQEKDTTEITGTGEDPIAKRTAYLKNVYSIIKSNTALSNEDIARLEDYKQTLKRVRFAEDKNIVLNDEGQELFSKILSWSPQYVGLTPIAPAVEDGDQVSVIVSRKFKGDSQAKETKVGDFRTSGGLGFDLGGEIFVTGLKNNNVFTETVSIDGNDELRAMIDDDDNQLSIGYGLNMEVSYRTASLFRPTLNIASFIPFEEDISPYFGFGPGVSISTQKVKFRLAGGIATGKVNAINGRYEDLDLSDIDDLTNESISEKVWQSSWYVSIGIRAKINKDKE